MDGKNKESLVSIITSTYNSSKFLSETINSVLEQTYFNWEWIIVDDCSSDNTQAIIKTLVKKDERVKFFSTENNSGGPAKPRNIGLEKARGKYVSFLDSDDVWMPEKIEKQIEEIGDYDGICSNFNIIDSDSKHQKVVNNKIKKEIAEIFLGNKSHVWQQALNRVHVQKSILLYCFGKLR